jgi:hypothetical protein
MGSVLIDCNSKTSLFIIPCSLFDILRLNRVLSRRIMNKEQGISNDEVRSQKCIRFRKLPSRHEGAGVDHVLSRRITDKEQEIWNDEVLTSSFDKHKFSKCADRFSKNRRL